MNTGVESVRKPVRWICIFWDRESVHEDESKGQTERMAGFYGLRLVFEKTHCILYDEFIVQTEEFHDFFLVSDPRSDDLQVYFAHVYLIK